MPERPLTIVGDGREPATGQRSVTDGFAPIH
jgi:hypothetical protein